MKQFNLQEYLANPNRQVVTRDGSKARIVCTDFNNPDFPVVGEIKGHKWPLSFATNGTSIKGRQLCSDLFFAPEKHEAWINLFRDCCTGVNYPGCRLFNTKKEAKQNLAIEDDRYIATIKIEWEE